MLNVMVLPVLYMEMLAEIVFITFSSAPSSYTVKNWEFQLCPVRNSEPAVVPEMVEPFFSVT